MNKQKIESKYWNPYLETLDYEKIKRLQLRKFKDILKYAFDNSLLYREIYEEAGLKPEDIQSFEDIQKVPIIDKKYLINIWMIEVFMEMV